MVLGAPRMRLFVYQTYKPTTAIKITSPTQQGVQVGGLPYSLAVTAIADSNINTDVRFKLNGAVVV